MNIKIKYFSDIIPVEKISNGDWVDLRAAETVELREGEFKLIPLGVGMILPEGYEAHIVPRSSTFKNYVNCQPILVQKLFRQNKVTEFHR